MNALQTQRQLLRKAQSCRRSSYVDAESALSLSISRLCLTSHRSFSFSRPRNTEPDTHMRKPTKLNPDREKSKSETSLSASAFIGDYLKAKPVQLRKTDAQIAAEKTQAAKDKHDKQMAEARKISERQGTLAGNSLFADDEKAPQAVSRENPYFLGNRNVENMTRALVLNTKARTRWQKKMVIRQVRRSGRLSKEMKIGRTERSHLAKSHFFKTSMKKLAPLARQIAGKSVEEAILQMRFSVKKAARDVRQHLIQARDEAIVMRGMGLPPPAGLDKSKTPSDGIREFLEEPTAEDMSKHLNTDPALQPRITTSLKSREPGSTDMYIAQAWVNRGPYGRELEYRARGRVNMLRPPYTGISILLKEEKTRTREKEEKEAKAIRKRLGKNMWTQLPDRPITRQSQHILW